jgi:predicted transcriptional regulator
MNKNQVSQNSLHMKLHEIVGILKADVFSGQTYLDKVVKAAAASDLMSDVLRGPTDGAILLTGLNNIQVIRTSVIAGLSAVVIIRGKRPTEEMITQAREHEIPLLSTPFTLFSACGRLFARGLPGVDVTVSQRGQKEQESFPHVNK